MGGVREGYGEGLSLTSRTLAQAVFSKGGELLSLTGDIFEQWKEHFEELTNLTNTSSVEETELEDSGEASPIALAEVFVVVKNLSRTCPTSDPVVGHVFCGLGKVKYVFGTFSEIDRQIGAVAACGGRESRAGRQSF